MSSTWDTRTLAILMSFCGAGHAPWDLAGPATERVRGAMAHAAAETLGVLVDVQDIHVQRSRCPDGPSVHLAARWAPDTCDVELVGGPGDGEHYTLRDVTRGMNYTDRGLATWPDRVADIFSLGRASRVHYSLAGWNPDTRRWILS